MELQRQRTTEWYLCVRKRRNVTDFVGFIEGVSTAQTEKTRYIEANLRDGSWGAYP